MNLATQLSKITQQAIQIQKEKDELAEQEKLKLETLQIQKAETDFEALKQSLKIAAQNCESSFEITEIKLQEMGRATKLEVAIHTKFYESDLKLPYHQKMFQLCENEGLNPKIQYCCDNGVVRAHFNLVVTW